MKMFWYYLALMGVFVIVTESADGDVRLVGRPRTYMGRVEIEVGSTWYSVCDVGWGIEEANVVCRQLGFPAGAMFSSVTPRSDFGIGTGNMLWSDYDCTGSESDFISCDSAAGLSSSVCDISDNVAIICNVAAYLGCYDILEDEYPPGLERVSSATGSIELCLGVCRSHSTHAALGVQGDRDRCFCFSGDYTTLTALSNERCNNKCTDDDREACGGVNAYSVYPVTLGEVGVTYTNDDTGYIYSPNFFGQYPPDLDTTWTISFTDRKIVTLNSIMFLLDAGDSVTVSDGNSESSFGSNIASLTFVSDATRTVTLQFTTADDSDGNYGFIVEYTTSDAPATEPITSKPATTEAAVVTTEKDVVTTVPDEPKTTLADIPTIKTTEADDKTTVEVNPTTVVAGTMPSTTLEGDEATEVMADSTTPVTESTTLMNTNTEPACPVLFGSSSISNQIDGDNTDQLIIAYDMPFECATIVTAISFYASAETTYTLLVLSLSEDSDYIVVSKVDIISSSPSVVDEDLCTSVVANAGDLVAIAFESGSLSFSEDHSGTMKFRVYDTEYSDFATVNVGDTLDLPDSSTDVDRQYPFQLTMRQAIVCDLSDPPEGGSYSVSSLLEGQSTMFVCYDGFRAKLEDEEDDDNDYVNVTCTDDGNLVHNGYCQDYSHNTTYIIIFTTIVACLGFCLIIIYFAMICSRPDGAGRGSGDDVEKSASDENELLPIEDPDDEVDFSADDAQEEEGGKENEEAQDEEAAVEPEETGSQEDGEQSNPPSSAGEVGNVDNPVYESNDAMNANEWVPEEAGPDD